MFDTARHNLGYALRTLRLAPGFTVAAVLTLALGIGANTAIFTVINAVVLRPLPYHEPDRLVTVEHFYPSLNEGMETPVSVPGFRDYSAQAHLFQVAAVRAGWAPNLTGEGEPERLLAVRGTGEYFRVFGVAPILGRTFRTDEAEEGREKVAVLSHGFWQRRFGGDSAVVGRAVLLNGESYDVLGVMPPSFRDFWMTNADLFAPLVLRPEWFGDNFRTNEWLGFLARLQPGVSAERAQQDMHLFAAALRSEHPERYPADWDLHVTALARENTEPVRRALFLLFGAVGFVLLIACANVANLQLARMSARARDIAVRVALGASPRRLMGQLLTESIVLALAGGALGLLLAEWGVAALLALNPNLPATGRVGVDGTVLGFTIVISLATGFIFGVMPAAHAVRTDLHGTLKEGGRAAGDLRRLALRRGLVVTTVALALALLSGAGLLVRSFGKLVGVDPGFQAANLLTFNVSLPAARYPSDTARVVAFERITEAVAAVPGVRSVGGTSVLPFSGNWSTGSFNVEGYVPPENTPGPWGDIRRVTPGFLATLGVPLLRGRLLDASDGMGGRRVAVVDPGMVRRYWPTEDPIGKRLTFGNPADSATRWIEVVGVVGHTMHEGLDGQRRVQLYLPYAQGTTAGLALAVRTAGEPMALHNAVRAAIRAVDGDLPISSVNTMDALIERSTAPRRFTMLLLGAFAGLAVVLASIGLYGVMSYSVTQRTQEIGVRLALGAGAGQVQRLVLGQGMRLAVVGVAVGVGAALALGRVMRGLLFEVSATDPVTFVAMAGLLVGVAGFATWLPARRAARVDPVEALRSE